MRNVSPWDGTDQEESSSLPFRESATSPKKYRVSKNIFDLKVPRERNTQKCYHIKSCTEFLLNISAPLFYFSAQNKYFIQQTDIFIIVRCPWKKSFFSSVRDKAKNFVFQLYYGIHSTFFIENCPFVTLGPPCMYTFKNSLVFFSSTCKQQFGCDTIFAMILERTAKIAFRFPFPFLFPFRRCNLPLWGHFLWLCHIIISSEKCCQGPFFCFQDANYFQSLHKFWDFFAEMVRKLPILSVFSSLWDHLDSIFCLFFSYYLSQWRKWKRHFLEIIIEKVWPLEQK